MVWRIGAHLESAARFKRPVVVAINLFAASDTAEEVQAVKDFCAGMGVRCAAADVFGKGGPGAEELARLVAEAADEPSPEFSCLYGPDDAVEVKMEKIATQMYGADGVDVSAPARKKLALLEKNGLTGLSVCMAKTQNSVGRCVSVGATPWVQDSCARFRDCQRRRISGGVDGYDYAYARLAARAFGRADRCG